MKDRREWEVKRLDDLMRSLRPGHIVVFITLLLSVVGFTFLRFTLSEDLHWITYLPLGGFMIFLVYVASSANQVREGTLDLRGQRLRLVLPGATREISLEGMEMDFAKQFAARTHRVFTGSLCRLRNGNTGESLGILGSGVEFPQETYGLQESYSGEMDIYMEAGAFQDLISTLEQECPSLRRQTDRESSHGGRPAQEQRFQASPMKGRVILPMAVWMGGIIVLGILSFTASSLLSNEVLAEVGPYLSIPIVLVLLVTVTLLSRRQGQREGELILCPTKVELRVNGALSREIRLPIKELRLLAVVVNTKIGPYYSGPAVEMSCTGKRRVRLLISDSSRTWKEEEGRVATTDFSISIDGGEALIRWLRQAGTPDKRLRRIDARAAGHRVYP